MDLRDKPTQTVQDLLEKADASSMALKAVTAHTDSMRANAEQQDRFAALARKIQVHDQTVAQALESAQSLRIDTGVFDERISDFVASINARHDWARLALGPIADIQSLTRSAAFGGIYEAQEQAARIAEQFNARFRMPEMGETARLAATIQESLQAQMQRMIAVSDSTADAMAAIRTPWLDIGDSLQSVASFAALQGIGDTLAASRVVFSDNVAASLRQHLGDWRTPIDWPIDVLDHADARASFYEDRGFDLALTDFPSPAFEQATEIARLWQPLPDLDEDADHHIPAQPASAELGFRRTNKAHDRLLRLERHLRHFIARQMHAAFGDRWVKQNVPGDIRAAWRDKRDKAKDAGLEVVELIEYADFTDYQFIILRKDNWNTVFKPVFRRKEFIIESFHRLHPVRLDTMHARLITQDDELLLLVEVKRLLKAIGVLEG